MSKSVYDSIMTGLNEASKDANNTKSLLKIHKLEKQNKQAELAWWKVILGIIGAIFILVAAQLIAQFASIPADLLNIPVVGIICEAIAYVLLAYFGEKLMMEKLFKIPMDSIRIKKPEIKVICVYTDNFWNNALVHACWNATTFGIMHIDTVPYDGALYTYVLETKSVLLSGGDFGIETSVISIMAYALAILVFLTTTSYKYPTCSPSDT